MATTHLLKKIQWPNASPFICGHWDHFQAATACPNETDCENCQIAWALSPEAPRSNKDIHDWYNRHDGRVWSTR